MKIWLLSTMIVFLWPREFTPNGVRNTQKAPPDVLCITVLYIATFMSLRIMCLQWVLMLLPFADKAHFNGTIVLILGACDTRPMSLLGVELVSSLLWNAWSLWPFIFSPAVLWHPWFQFGHFQLSFDWNQRTWGQLGTHLAGIERNSLTTGILWVSND